VAITAIKATITVQQTCRWLSCRFMVVSYSNPLPFLGVEIFCRSTRHMTPERVVLGQFTFVWYCYSGSRPIAQTDSLQSPRSDILPALKRPSLKSRSGIYLCRYPRRNKKIVEVVEELPYVSSPSLSRLVLCIYRGFCAVTSL